MTIHFVGAAYLMLLGPWQFVTIVRRMWPALHKWNGRLTLLATVLAGVGGIYYVGSVGLTTAPQLGTQVNVLVILFGLSVLVCGAGIYYHAVWTKRFDLHKLWAYRLAGLFFGNIFARLYFVALRFVIGEHPDPMVSKSAGIILNYIFCSLSRLGGRGMEGRTTRKD